jgi:hypothetical protein
VFRNIKKDLADGMEENRLYVNQSLKSLESEIERALDKKVSSSEINGLLANKADTMTINIALQSKASISELDSIKLTVDRISKDTLNKLDFNKFDAYMNDTRFAIDELQKDLMMKANIKEMLTLLKNKSDIDDVNKALSQIHEELDLKCNIEHV